jgi:two-component system response regulator HydG
LVLAQHFLEHFASTSRKQVNQISDAVAQKLLSYDWPGNVRELRNAIERAVVFARHDVLTVDDLPAKVRSYQSEQMFVGGHDPTELLPMDEVERRYIHHVLRVVGGNKARAARVLGFDRKTLYRKLERAADESDGERTDASSSSGRAGTVDPDRRRRRSS